MTEQEMTDLYNEMTVELPGSNTLRVLTLGAFAEAIKLVERKAYAEGHNEGVKFMGDIVDLGFKGLKL